jgi:hypothetical protein
MSPETPRPEVTAAVSTLEAYLQGTLSLDELIDWAEALGGRAPEHPWLKQVSSDLANPLLCRELALALVREHLRSRAADEGRGVEG